MNDFVIKDGVLEVYQGEADCVEVPQGIRRIGRKAFWKCTGVKKVILPEGVECIEPWAFSGCRELQEVVLPESVTSIGYSAFDTCKMLQEVRLPRGLKRITAWMFGNCVHLTEVVLPEELQNIGDGAFQGCSALTDLQLPKKLQRIGDAAFQGCSALTGLQLPEGLKEIAGEAFAECTALQTLRLPESLQSIGVAAFQKCTSLQEVSFPDQLEVIEKDAFIGCSALQKVQLPGKVRRIGERAFAECPALHLPSLPETLVKIGRCAFEACIPPKQLILPQNLQKIEEWAINAKSNLEYLEIPSDCLWIEKNAFSLFSEDGILNAPKLELSVLRSAGYSKQALRGFLQEYRKGTHFRDREGYLAKIRRGKETYLRKKYPDESLIRILMDEELLTEKDADGLLGGVDNGVGSETRCLLVDYLEKLCPAEKRHQREMQAEAETEQMIEASITGIYPVKLAEKSWTLEPIDKERICIKGYKGEEESVSVPWRIGSRTVTEIGPEAFSPARWHLARTVSAARGRLREVVLPEGVERIGAKAFRSCLKLERLHLPQSVVWIAPDAVPNTGKIILCAPEGSQAQEYALSRKIPFEAE